MWEVICRSVAVYYKQLENKTNKTKQNKQWGNMIALVSECVCVSLCVCIYTCVAFKQSSCTCNLLMNIYVLHLVPNCIQTAQTPKVSLDVARTANTGHTPTKANTKLQLIMHQTHTQQKPKKFPISN